ncbi:uncharacterized [Tachysurus ichikawai]
MGPVQLSTLSYAKTCFSEARGLTGDRGIEGGGGKSGTEIRKARGLYPSCPAALISPLFSSSIPSPELSAHQSAQPGPLHSKPKCKELTFDLTGFTLLPSGHGGFPVRRRRSDDRLLGELAALGLDLPCVRMHPHDPHVKTVSRQRELPVAVGTFACFSKTTGLFL